MSHFKVRQIEERDNAQILKLMSELGYAMTAELMQQKIREVLSSDRDCAYVAEVRPLFHAPGHLGRITSLVVSAAYQRAGIGSQLAEAAEAFARGHDCVKMEVTSGDHRAGAHNFYQRAGYEQTAHGRFIKVL